MLFSSAIRPPGVPQKTKLIHMYTKSQNPAGQENGVKSQFVVQMRL
jgi:hypothetical protein